VGDSAKNKGEREKTQVESTAERFYISNHQRLKYATKGRKYLRGLGRRERRKGGKLLRTCREHFVLESWESSCLTEKLVATKPGSGGAELSMASISSGDVANAKKREGGGFRGEKINHPRFLAAILVFGSGSPAHEGGGEEMGEVSEQEGHGCWTALEVFQTTSADKKVQGEGQ